jgi:sulfatase maturation enzyme AslB (radical SAM superfamily)
MAKFSEKFFCPAPWIHMYYQVNSPSPCHIIRNHHLNMTPEEYVNSDWLKRIKTDMVEGRVPSECSNCKQKEDLGLKSTRGATWRYYNVGPEPNYEDMWFYNKFDADTPTEIHRLELRFSNLCNMKCRMCDETSSSEWALEKKKHNLPPNRITNPNGIVDITTSHILKITEDKIDGLKDTQLMSNLQRVCFTGGEPLIIKEYYDYLDFLIESELNKQADIELFTNCSVYNPLFVDRLNKFKNVNLVMSIDGVGKTAEYIRHGMPWETIKKNVHTFNSLQKPIQLYVNVAISAYTLLDVSSLAKFLMELFEANNTLAIKCYTVLMPGQRFQNAPLHLQKKMIEEVDKALEILTAPNFLILKNELTNIRSKLVLEEELLVDSFYKFTRGFDSIRNENFEEVFNLPLYPQTTL